MEIFDLSQVILHDKLSFDGVTNINNIPLKLYGKVPCGKFGFYDDEVDGYIEIPKKLIGNKDYFVLTSNGDSMVNAGIFDGDLVIVQKQNYAQNGDVVVVMYNDAVTLKRFYTIPNQKKFRLHPENEKYEDIIVDECQVLGIVVKILKNIN